MKLPEPVAWMVTAEMQDGSHNTFPLNGRYKDVRDTCDVGEPVPLFTEAQMREALASHEAVMRMALGCLKNSNAVSFDDLHAIKALEEQLK